MLDIPYRILRRVHICCGVLVALVAVIHMASTWTLYDGWSSDALWFFGTGLSLFQLATLNLSHIGFEPCRMPTTRLVRISNWVYVLFAIAACVAVRELHAYVLTVILLIQAIVARWTLPGLAHCHDVNEDADEEHHDAHA